MHRNHITWIFRNRKNQKCPIKKTESCGLVAEEPRQLERTGFLSDRVFSVLPFKVLCGIFIKSLLLKTQVAMNSPPVSPVAHTLQTHF